ncbi:hypothetical protein FOL46_007362 [Perkinsus olseni]|uniref:Uncharacterized protein n=1 Tax=Perkinsus olseni TaxID=32597 RepID=A0A7J6LEE4_PEROL|nr:hypothetical protein FOL46_007362 [Perkinsus olseni]
MLDSSALGFDSGSLQQFLRQPRPLLHPVSRKVIPNDVLERADKFINDVLLVRTVPYKQEADDSFKEKGFGMDSCEEANAGRYSKLKPGVVVDERTLLKMSKEQLARCFVIALQCGVLAVAVVQELHSMFMNNFTSEQKRQLRPPKGQPFAFVPRAGNGRVNATNLPLALAQYILRELRQILRRAPQNLKYMVSYVAVGALSSVDGELRASNYYISEMLSRRATAAVCLILYIVGGVKTEVDDAMLGTGQLVQKVGSLLGAFSQMFELGSRTPTTAFSQEAAEGSFFAVGERGHQSHDAKRGPSKTINIIYVTTGSLLILLAIGFLTKTVILDKPEGEVASVDETPLVGETPTVMNAEEKDEPEPEVIEIEGGPEDVEVDIEEGQPKEAAGQSRRARRKERRRNSGKGKLADISLADSNK